ncbi:MAG: DPP IV N-terminal domain-containing protein [Phycisphaerales bacterium]|jgi:TolB protein|nr:DPP IV N-terminal domain-containing protein [Phycisphaerales bacterium]
MSKMTNNRMVSRSMLGGVSLLTLVGMALGGCATSPTNERASVPAPVPATRSTETASNTTPSAEPASRTHMIAARNTGRPLNQPGGTSLYGDILSTAIPAEADRALEQRDTTNLTQVTYTFEGSDFDPVVSQDGSFLVFASTQHQPTADLYFKRVNSKVVTRLTDDPAEDAMPAISPDGSHVAFTSNRTGNWDVFVMPVEGGRPVQITSDKGHELHPSWSPDGRTLVFCRLGVVSGRWEMWTVNLENPATSSFIGYGLFPEWCPVAATGESGADRIVYQLARERGERSFSLWTLDYKDGQAFNQSLLKSSAINALINPTWSPDGKYVLYASVPNPGEWGDPTSAKPEVANLWMVNVEGGGLVNLTAGQAVDLMPCWGPNERVYFVSDRSGSDNLWSIDVSQSVMASASASPTRGGASERGVLTNVQDQNEYGDGN